MAKRFPLVVDTENNNRIIELPVDDCLDLTGSDICSVENITVTGTITLPTGPVTSFSGSYADLADPPFIPDGLVDLGIQDGLEGQFLRTDGDGNFSFQTISVLWDNVAQPPDIPDSLLDLNIDDGTTGQYLQTDGAGNFSFVDITDVNFGNLSLDVNTISNTAINQSIIIQPNGLGAVRINTNTTLVIPVGDSSTRTPNVQGAIRFNTELNNFEGYNGTGWASLGGVRSLDGENYILGETTPGASDDKLLFYTDGVLRLEIGNDNVTFDPSVNVNIETLSVGTLQLEQSLDLSGDITIGDSVDDTFTLYSKIDGNIIPKITDTYEIGKNDFKWRNLHISERAFINEYELPLTDGSVNQIVKTNGEGALEFANADLWGGNRVYVSSEHGDDENDGITAPVRTIKRAAQIAGGMVFEPVTKDELIEHETSLLRAAKKDIADATIKYIADTYGNTFGYDTIKCRRDMDYILDAVLLDQALGTNYNQVVAANSFYRANAAYTLANENTATIGALNELKNQIANYEIWTTALADINAGINQIRDAIDNGVGVINPITYPTPTTLPTPNAVDAKDRLYANVLFVQDEVTAWIAENYPSLNYDSAKCRRDIGYIFEALQHDILYGGNFGSINNAKAYFVGTSGQLGAGQETATAAAYTHMIAVVKQIVQGQTVTATTGNVTPQDFTGNNATITEALRLQELIEIVIQVINDNSLDNITRSIMPDTRWSDIRRNAANSLIRKNQSLIKNEVINFINVQYNFYDSIKCHRDVQEIIDSVIYDLRYGGNSRTVAAGESYYDGNLNLYIVGQVTETQGAITYAKTLASAYLTGTRATALEASMDLINAIITDIGVAPTKVYGEYKIKNVTIMVATGDYIEDNPLILPDNVSIVGDNLRRAIVRPKNANKDMFKVRNSVYATGIVFRDHLDATGTPDYTFRYCVSFDNPLDTATSRAGYGDLPVTKPKIFTSPYIQNCSVISFLGGNGVEIDGNLVDVPNVPPTNIEAENPVDLVDGIPEQGKSMVANAFTILSFGGNAWRVINDAYAQIVSCFVIFCENGCLTQNGGYLSITNSASNFGLFSLRSTGYSQNSFIYDRGYVFKQLEIEGFQTFGVLGLKRAPLEHYVLRLKNNQGNADITDQFLFNENNNLVFAEAINPDITNVAGNQITFPTAHNFLTGDYVEYDANGDAEIVGLLNEVKYYVSVPSPTSIILYHDADFGKPVRSLDPSVCTGTHYFRKGDEYIYVEEILETHNTYQDWQMPETEGGQTVNYGIIVGNFFTATNTNGKVVNAAVAAWDFDTKTLTVSIEYVTEGNDQVRNLGDAGTTIPNGPLHSFPGGDITVLSTAPRTDLFTSDFKILTTENTGIEDIGNTVTKQVYFHRPSICNSSAHTWEFAGSGIDYNALPQNGGLTDEFFEQVSTVPGRVYSSGTNEIGDFKVGTFVRAYNRTGNIDFKNKVNIGELDSLSLSLSSGIVVSSISGDIELGDNEIGGPSNSRLITQLAIRSFLENRLGDFIDKQVSANAIPSSVVQLNSSGQINSDLIPPQGNFTAYIVEEYEGRLDLHNTIPVTDLKAGDIVIEEYDEITLTSNYTVTLVKDEVLEQVDAFGTVIASGIVKINYLNATEIKLIEPFFGTFTTNVTANTLQGSVSGPLVDNQGPPQGVYPIIIAGPSEIRENYFITTSRAKQYLITDPSQTYTFTQLILDQTQIQGAVSGAVATVDEYREGVLTGLDIINDVPGGTGYTTGNYVDVQMVYASTSPGSKLGQFALADITVDAQGTITTVDVKRGGYGYAAAELLTVPTTPAQVTLTGATYVPRSAAGLDLEIAITNVENRLYITLELSAGLEFNATNTNLDFIIDDTDISVLVTQGGSFQTSFLGDVTGIDQANDYIIFQSAHPYVNGDHVKYDVNNNPQVIGGLTNLDTYYVKVIDATTIQLYTDYGLQGQNLVNLTSAPGGQAAHILLTDHVSIDVDRFYIPAHGLSTGDAVKVTVADPPSGMIDGEFLFVGSVTTNTFTLHDARGSALSSANGLVVASQNYLVLGTGDISLRKQTVIISGDANTSGQLETSWSNLTSTTIDADNIISGIINPARLGTGSANTSTYLRGDNSWWYAVSGLKNTTLNDPLTITGSFYNDGLHDIYYGDLDLKIEKAGYLNPANPLANEETVGVAAFAFDFFSITSDGLVTTKSTFDGGEIDAKYLSQQPASYYRNPVNLSRDVPIEHGGTNLSAYATGDMLFAATALPTGNAYSSSLSTLAIGNQYDILTVDGNGHPSWTGNIILNSATIGDVQIAVNGSNEIDTIAGDLIIDSATGETTINDNLTVTGNLTVEGSTTTLNTTILEVEDLNITVAKNATSTTEANGAGLTVNTGNILTDAVLYYDSATDSWNVNKDLDADGFVFKSTATVGFEGNASSADIWATARTITFEDNGGTATGVTGSFTIDGSANIGNVVLTLVDEAVQDIVGSMIVGNTENGISVSYDDLTGKINFDVNDPIISITGSVSGSATMSDLGNVEITVSPVADSVALGTHTTGNFAADISIGEVDSTAGLAITGTAGEGTSYTISHADTSSQASTNNSAGTVIANITLDTYGHVTGIGTASVALTLDAILTNGSTSTQSITTGTHHLPNIIIDGGNTAVNTSIGSIIWRNDDSTAVDFDFAYIDAIATDLANGSEAGNLRFYASTGGAAPTLTYYVTAGSIEPGSNNSKDLGTSSNVWANLHVTTANAVSFVASTNVSTSGLTVTSTATFEGDVDLGNANTDTVTFTSRIDSNVLPSADITYNLGDTNNRWNTVYAATFAGTATSAQYADLAEMYAADGHYTPGTVMMFGGDKEVTAAKGLGTTKIIGVVSTDPAYLMNSKLENGTAIALKGRVPCLVIGKVEKGDMLIASDVAGVAIVTKEFIGGAIIGKAIEASDDLDIKVIEIAVGVL